MAAFCAVGRGLTREPNRRHAHVASCRSPGGKGIVAIGGRDCARPLDDGICQLTAGCPSTDARDGPGADGGQVKRLLRCVILASLGVLRSAPVCEHYPQGFGEG